MEVWKDVRGYEGSYQVSSFGRVKSLKGNKEKFLKTTPNSHGYLRVNLSFNGKRKTTKIHQLVAIAFLDHAPNGYKVVVDHIDNNKLNNSVDNLQLTTVRHNSSKDRTGGSSKCIGVSWNKKAGKWTSQIMINGKQKHLGYFINEEEASEAYQKALIQIKKGTPKNIEVKKAVFSSKYTGVTWYKTTGKWMSQIKINGKKKHLGYFINEEEASDAYQTALKALKQ